MEQVSDQSRLANHKGPSPAVPGLSPSAFRAALTLAEAIIPGSDGVPGADERTVRLVESWVREQGRYALTAWGVLNRVMEGAALCFAGRRFSDLSRSEQERVLESWGERRVLRSGLAVLTLVNKLVHFDEDRAYRMLGGSRTPPCARPPERWLDNATSAAQWPASQPIECDVAVVGTGAGGAVVAAELAQLGHGVALVEEGRFLRRHEFRRSSLQASAQYFQPGLVSIGNTVIPIFAGRLVGGSTAVNTGTCYRPPRRVLEQWCESLNTDEFSPSNLQPYLEQIETRLGVEPCPRKTAGPFADLVAGACERLGWRHGPIFRNAPGCEGEGFCIFGCASEARRSANVTFIPAALKSGALLLTGAQAVRVLLENGRAVGVVARSVETGQEVLLRAPMVVLAGGAIRTPLLLLEQGIGNSSGRVGNHLALHPSACVSAEFEVEVNGHYHVPQGYGSDHFLEQGILLNGALADYSLLASTLGTRGTRLVQTLEARNRVAGLGVLVEDQGPGGRVRRLARGRPLITYLLSKRDVTLLHEGMSHALQILRAAGAVRCYPLIHSLPRLESSQDDLRFRARVPTPADFMLTSYHPMGTCRMSRSPREGVVGLNHEVHDVKNLFIVDASSLPGPPAVNPQITIMAMALRAARRIAERL